MTHSELEEANHHLAQIAPNLRVDRLLGQWRQFVDRLDEPYRFTTYDYAEDLSTREILERLRRTCPDALAEVLSSELWAADARFMEQTDVDELGLIPATDPPWLRRIPRQVTSEFTE